MSKVTVFDMGTTTGPLVEKYGTSADRILACAGVAKEDADIYEVYENPQFPDLKSVKCVIVSGSGAMVTDKPDWAMQISDWLKKAAELHIPILGICFGHQLVAYTFGGKVDWCPNGTQAMTNTIVLNEEGQKDAILGVMPKTFLANEGHSQSVVELPPDAIRLASSEFEPNESYRIGDNIWGIQFHPEIKDTLLKEIVLAWKDTLEKQGKDAQKLYDSIVPTHCCEILKKFVELAQ